MLKRQFLWVTAILAASCGNESPTQPTSSTGSVANIVVEPRAVNGGSPSIVTITLNAPASAPTQILLTSESPAVVIPASVTVAAGSSTASVAVSTSPVSRDTTAIITAWTGGTSMRSTLVVWRIEPTSFWYDARATDRIGYDAVGRYTADTALFRATCDVNGIYVEWSQPPSTRWELSFIAPRGTPLRPGTYDVPQGFFEPGPRLRVDGPPYVCATGKARFVVETFEHGTTSDVGRFVATIEQQQCVGAGVFRAEIRLTDPPRTGANVSPGSCLP